MAISKIKQNNQVRVEQYNKIVIQNRKPANIPDNSNKHEIVKAKLESNLVSNMLRLYDKNGNLINRQDIPNPIEIAKNIEVIEDIKQNENLIQEKDASVKSDSIINYQPAIPMEENSKSTWSFDRFRGQYLVAIYGMVKKNYASLEERFSKIQTTNKNFSVLSLFGITLCIIILFYFLILK